MKRTTLGHIIAAGLTAVGMVQSLANPTGGQVVSGSASIGTIPGTVTINQASNIAIINWQTFSIGSGELTKFVQPCSSSAALNRVLGGQTSIIDGTLSANGQVYLINGNGVVVGPGGVVTANTFLASTRDIADADFVSGNFHFTGSNPAGVQNQGTINALGGDVYLIGKTVDNTGNINAPNGTAGLASGDDVMLNQCGQEHVFVSPSPTATSAATQAAVHNGGTIAAASAELKAANGNLFALAINNEGTIRATAVCQKGGRIFLTTDAGMIQNTGTITAKSGANGGSVKITGGSVWNRKTIDASGAMGGSVTINSQNVQNDGAISVKGTQCDGGTVAVTYSGNALGSVTGLIDASGANQGGSIQFLGTGPTSEAYLSLTLNVNGACMGGSIGIDAPTIYLTGATLTANGGSQGGSIFVGQGAPGSTPILALAQTVYVSLGTFLTADATSAGNGGQIGVTGTGVSDFFGGAEAKGAGTTGVPGAVTVLGPASPDTSESGSGNGSGSGGSGDGSSSGNQVDTADVTATASNGSAFEFVDPDPGSNDAFGRPFTGIFNLASNNTLITSPGDNFGGAGAGAAYLFSDSNGTLLSTVRGSHAGDGVGSNVELFVGGNFVLDTPSWNGNVGAVTFGNGLTGFANGGGAVSASNSLVGNASGDLVGSGGVFVLFNGDTVVLSPNWNNHTGAATWVDPAVGATGAVGAGNSLVGSSSGDAIGSGGVIQLGNGANYLVLSPEWNGGMGAITNGSDASAIFGAVTASNSLVGSTAGDHVGAANSVLDTDFGYYLVTTTGWSNGTGAVTWSNDDAGVGGPVSASNSLVGTASGDGVGSGGITLLYGDHNYVVSSPNWNGETGAVTWGDGSAGVKGTVSASNSLVGAAAGDRAGSGGVTDLPDEAAYAVSSPYFSNRAGAVTVASDATGITNVISGSNSLVGAAGGDLIGSDGITILNNGNFLILSPSFDGDAGAVTFESISNLRLGIVDAGNSLIGLSEGDEIGSGGIVQLSNGGNFLVLSPLWSGGKGAVTNGSTSTGVLGTVSAANSLVGSSDTDHVGGSGSITDAFTGYYLVSTPNWDGGEGAVTWNSDGSGVKSAISAANSLVGSSAGDRIGSGGIITLFNNDYVVVSPNWSGQTGAVTWGNASGTVKGVVGGSNSLVGQNPGDEIGSGGIFQLSNIANYLVLSPLWGNGAGAITNEESSSATSGIVSGSNSLVGAEAGDHVGAAGTITDPFTGYYLVTTSASGNGAGAVTWSSDTGGVVGAISDLNSLVGSSSGDHVGSGGITVLNNGNYLVDSPNWAGQTGAVTWGIGATGTVGLVSAENSLVGASPGDQIGSSGITLLPDGNYLVLSPHFASGAGAVTWGDQSTPTLGNVSDINSLVGSTPGDAIGSGGIVQLANGANYLVLSPSWSGGEGAITYASDATGVSGIVSSSNSLVGAIAGDHVGAAGSIVNSNVSYYLVLTSGWNNGAGAVTWNSDGSGKTGVVSAANSLVGASSGDDIGSSGVAILSDGNYLVFSPQFAGNDGAVTFAGGAGGIAGEVGASNSLIGAASGDRIGSGGITLLDDGNYLILSPSFAGGAGAVTWGSDLTGIATGVLGASNSLVGVNSSDHIASGGIILLPNGDFLVQSPLFDGSAGAVTWGSESTGIAGQVSSLNSITGGGPDSGEEYAGLSADGSIYLVAFTTDTSAGGDGRVVAGSVNGTSTPSTPLTHDFFEDQSVISFETSGFNHLLPDSSVYISDPEALPLDAVSVDALTGGAVNEGKGNNLASGSSTSLAPGPQRLVTPGNGIWNIFGGIVHSAPPPSFVNQQLQINLSPAVFAQLHEILFGNP